MLRQRWEKIKAWFKEGPPVPALLCLEHLHSEYASLKCEDEKFTGEEKKFMGDLFANREQTPPSWQDLYRFELILAKCIPDSMLLSKVKRLRFEFQSIVGQKEYDDYLASKPAYLQSPPDIEDETKKPKDYYEKLRDDLRDLLDRIYMRYAILPHKEKKLNYLTAVSAGLCFVSLFLLLSIVVLLFLWDFRNTKDIASLTIIIVVVTGAMGGFVSALRRIQTQPAHGDSIYNLSLLYHGSHSVLVAPVSGAIFAILLYLMFTSQVLRGTFFPEIYTPRAQRSFQSGENTGSGSRNRPAPFQSTQANENTNKTKTETSQPAGSGNQAAAANTTTVTAGSSTPTPTPPANENTNKTETEGSQPADSGNEAAAANTNATETTGASTTGTPKTPPPTPEPVAEKSLKVLEFLEKSGPAGGKDYALLILWCFIAGFAERFVPDALDRFIKRSGAGDGGKN